LLRTLTCLLSASVLVGALAEPAAAVPGGRATVRAPSTVGLRPTVLLQPARALLAQRVGGLLGGTYTTSTGETVTVFSSAAYAADTSFNQAHAEAIARLPHGHELASVTAFFLTFDEMQSICGEQALACYAPRDESLVALGEDAPDGTDAESILAHEYGHHVARNRINAPWRALTWGTKRWATQLGICSRERAGEVFPGDPFHYDLDPAEGFAEAYRMTAETLAGKEPVWWGIVNRLFLPDAAARTAIARDVASPWRAGTLLTRTGAFARTGAGSRSFRISTPLDGTLLVTVKPPARSLIRVSVSGDGARDLARGSSAVPTVQTTICGERTVVIRVDRVRGAGAFRLRISRP
jgi:hypothetical protein